MNRVQCLCKLIENHHFCLYLRHSLVPRRSLLTSCLREVCELVLSVYLSVTSQLTVESRIDRAENALGLGCLRHIWVLLTSLLHCQTWKCKYSLDRKNKFTSKKVFLTLRTTWLPVLRIWSQVHLEGTHTKSSHKSKILTSEAKEDSSSVLSPKKYGKSWGKKSFTFEAPETQLSRFLIKLR